jgi:hypothetical protein
MSIGGFIDSITNVATLVVVPDYKKDRYIYIPSSIQNLTLFSTSTPSYINGVASITFNNSSAFTLTLNQQDDPNDYYNNLGLDIIRNRTSIYISNTENYPNGNFKKYFNSRISNFTFSQANVGNFQQATSNYKIKHKHSSTNIYIRKSQDDLLLQYNVLSDKVSQTSPLPDSSENENGGGNNNQSTLKEFWA